MTDIAERLRRDLMEISYDDIETMCREAADQIERLRALLEAKITPGYELLATTLEKMEADNARLRAALEPFARNAKATSLLEALEHIEREHLLAARAALEPKP